VNSKNYELKYTKSQFYLLLCLGVKPGFSR